MNLHQIDSHDDLAVFIDHLRNSFETNQEAWENTTLSSFLEAMAAWLRDMDGYYQQRDSPVPRHPSWRFIGELLLASTIYE